MNARCLYIQDTSTGLIRLTATARSLYGARLARVGHRVEDIRTMAQFEAAIDAMFQHDIRTLRTKMAREGELAILDDILSGLPGWHTEP